jgi:hypothetical protein
MAMYLNPTHATNLGESITMHMLSRTPLRFAALAAALTVMAATAAPAQADTALIIGLQEAGVNGGAITMYPTAAGLNAAYGTFSQVNPSGIGNPAQIAPTPTVPLLQAATIDVSTVPGTLVVWMTASGNLGANLPLGTQAFESSFRQNLLPDGWTVQVDTFLDPADGIFTTAIPLSSHLFRASDPTFDQIVRADPGNGFYSVTARFTISANDIVGSTNTTADIAFVPPARAVPGPIAGAGLPGLILASGGLFGWWRRRQRAGRLTRWIALFNAITTVGGQ